MWEGGGRDVIGAHEEVIEHVPRQSGSEPRPAAPRILTPPRVEHQGSNLVLPFARAGASHLPPVPRSTSDILHQHASTDSLSLSLSLCVCVCVSV